MSEKPEELASNYALEADSQEPVSEEQEQQAKPQYLTREEAQRLLKEQEDKVLRQTQSLTDKASSRLDKQLRDELKKINEVIDLQKAAGIQITPEQESAMRQKVYDNTLKKLSEEPEDSNAPAQQGMPDSPEQVLQMASAAVIDNMVNEIYKETGITIYENDPEVDMVDKSTPMAFLRTLQQAVEKKKQRIQTAPEARIASLGKGQQTNLEAQYLEEKGKIHGDVEALINLKKKYRAKGLQI